MKVVRHGRYVLRSGGEKRAVGGTKSRTRARECNVNEKDACLRIQRS